MLNVTRAGRRSGKILTTRVFGLLKIPREISFVSASQITFEEFLILAAKKMDRDVDQMYRKIFEMLAMVGRMEKPTEFDQRAGRGTFVYFTSQLFCFFIRLAI